MRPQSHPKARCKPSDKGGRNVQFWATPLLPQLYKPNRLLEPGRHLGESPDTRRTLAGHAPWITLMLPGAPLASAGPRHIRQAYGKWAEGGFPAFGPLWGSGSATAATRRRAGDFPPCQAGAASVRLMQALASSRCG